MRLITNTEEQYHRMLETPIPKLVSSLFLPTVASMLITTLYNTADTYFVSQMGTSAAAAVGVVFSLMSIIQAAGFGIGMGASSLISRRLGEKEDEEASRIASSAFAMAVAFGVLLLTVGLLTLPNLMRMLGATPTILPYAMDYGRIILIGAPVMCSAFVLNNTLRSEGEPFFSMIGLCSGGLLNILLDPLLIFTFGMGIAGAALATVLSQCVSFSILFSFFLRKKSIVRLHPALISRDADDYGRILRTGLPTISRQGLGSLASAMTNIAAAPYGDAAVAAITIATKVYLFTRNIVLGVGQGFQPAAGYNFGAKRYDRVREAFRFSVLIGTGFCVIIGALLITNASHVIMWFRRDDPEVIRIGTQTLYFVCGVMPFMAFSTYVNQLYQCLGFAWQATLLACCRQGICFLPAILLLPGLLGLTGVEMAQPIADLATFFISIPCLVTFYKRHLKTQIEQK